jgi:3-oxoacyl-[acyl-carrier protein] reductase
MSKNILVTGVSQGLGLAIARAVVAAGWTLFGVSRRLSPEFEALRAGNPDRVRFFACDLADARAARAKIFSEFVPLKTPLHGLVNNAAAAYDDLVTNLDADRLEAMFELNVFAPMLFTREALRNMILHGQGGAIVHISSISAHTGYKGLAMYAATKGALEAFSKNTAREWGERGIRSNCVVAGFMETEMSGGLSPEQKERIFQRTALKRATAPDSVAASCVFLLSESAGCLTGQSLIVDSGTI